MLTFRMLPAEIEKRKRYRRALTMFKDLKPEMDQVGQWLIVDAGNRIARRRSPVSIGRLAKSLKHKAFKLAVTISSVLPYARVQQQGGTIRPRKRKWLAIPLLLEDKRVHIWPKHIRVRPSKDSPGNDLRFVPLGGGRALLIYEKWQLRENRLVRTQEYARFLLLKKVQLRGRPYLVKSRQLLDFMRQVIGAKLARENRQGA